MIAAVRFTGCGELMDAIQNLPFFDQECVKSLRSRAALGVERNFIRIWD